MHPFFHSYPFTLFFSGQLFLWCLVEEGEWRMGPILPECRFKGFSSLVYAILEFHFFTKLLYILTQVFLKWILGMFSIFRPLLSECTSTKWSSLLVNWLLWVLTGIFWLYLILARSQRVSQYTQVHKLGLPEASLQPFRIRPTSWTFFLKWKQ